MKLRCITCKLNTVERNEDEQHSHFHLEVMILKNSFLIHCVVEFQGHSLNQWVGSVSV